MNVVERNPSTNPCREEESGLYLELGHISLYYLQYDAAKVGTARWAGIVGLILIAFPLGLF